MLRGRAVMVATVLTALSACSASEAGQPEQPRRAPSSAATQAPPAPQAPRARRTPGTSEPGAASTSDGRPRRALISIPAIGVADLPVVPYRGRTDDAAGTRIQDSGVAASPYGPHGGVGPGGIGNYQVTAHRNSAGGPLFDLPDLARGSIVLVESGAWTYVYRVIATRSTSFRSPRSLVEQRAAVPGHPGAVPTRAMLTISTCATQEDHSAGNFWADGNDNPEHRIDKVATLVDVRPGRRGLPPSAGGVGS